MRKLVTAVGLGLLALVLLATPALAGKTWCSRDPVIKVNGQVVDVMVASTKEMLDAATGPVEIVVTVPEGVVARVYAVDRGFGYGYTISFATSASLAVSDTGTLAMEVAVYAPATDGELPVRVDVVPRSPGRVSEASVEGYANAWVTLQTP